MDYAFIKPASDTLTLPSGGGSVVMRQRPSPAAKRAANFAAARARLARPDDNHEAYVAYTRRLLPEMILSWTLTIDGQPAPISEETIAALAEEDHDFLYAQLVERMREPSEEEVKAFTNGSGRRSKGTR